MKRWSFWTKAIVSCVLFVAVMWQAGAYASLMARARELERVQEEWVFENRRLEAGIFVLSSRERAGMMAPRLGLHPAAPGEQLRITAAAGSAGSARGSSRGSATGVSGD